MNAKRSSDFKIRLDDETPDSVYQKTEETAQIKKLNRKITVLAIIVPCILCILFILAYITVQKRIVQLSDLKDIRELEEMYSSLSVQSARIEYNIDKMETSLDNKIQPVDKKTIVLDAEIKKIKSSLEKIDTDKKALLESVKKIQASIKTITGKNKETEANLKKSIGVVQKDLATTGLKIKDLETRLTEDIALFSGAAKALIAEFEKMKTDVLTLTANKVDKSQFILSQANEQENFQRELYLINNTFNDRITAMEKKNDGKIKAMEEKILELEKKLIQSAKNNKPVVNNTPTPKPAPKPEPKPEPEPEPEPVDGISEEEITD